MTQPPWSLELYETQHRIWTAWSESAAGASESMAYIAKLLELRPGDRVLDLGCGVGRELVALAKLGLRVEGLDISPWLVARARTRIQAAGVDALASTADLLDPPERIGRFDLLMTWDSTLNIFPLEYACVALRRWQSNIAPGGRICIHQLHDQYWKDIRGPFIFEGPDIGPGRSTRSYRFENGRLFDQVRYEPEEGPTEELPTQVLHLYPPAELERALIEIGFMDVRSFGSNGHEWTTPRHVDEKSSMVITVGRMS